MLAILVPLGWPMADTLTLKLFLVFGAVQILIVELLNSAVEAVVDRIGKEIHPLSGQAKDLGSAAQMVSLTLFLAFWLFLGCRYFLG